MQYLAAHRDNRIEGLLAAGGDRLGGVDGGDLGFAAAGTHRAHRRAVHARGDGQRGLDLGDLGSLLDRALGRHRTHERHRRLRCNFPRIGAQDPRQGESALRPIRGQVVDVDAPFTQRHDRLGESADVRVLGGASRHRMVGQSRVRPAPDDVVAVRRRAVQHRPSVGLHEEGEVRVADTCEVEEVRVLAERVDIVGVIARRFAVAQDQDRAVGHRLPQGLSSRHVRARVHSDLLG